MRRVVRWAASVALAVALTGGCGKSNPEDDKVAGRIVGTWARPLPLGVGEAREEILEFRADGTLVSRIGAMEQSSDWAVKDNRLVLGGTAPRPIQELSDTRLRFGEGEQIMQLTRKQPAAGGKGR